MNEKFDPRGRRLSRRDFLQFTGFSVTAAWLAACAANPAATTAPATSVPANLTAGANPTGVSPTALSPTAVSPTADALAPRRGGTWRILFNGDVPSLDAAVAFNWEDWWSSGLVLYNRLYSYDLNGKLQADVAADLPKISDDGLVYTIPIRKGVKFHNGREVTAEDVKFSLERQFWKEVGGQGTSYIQNILGAEAVADGTTKDLAGVKVLDPNTVQITLKSPQAVFVAVLSVSSNGILPKQEVLDAGADWGTKTVIGTGPFKLAEWLPGEKIVYERHPEYFRQGLPYLDRIELYLAVDNAVGVLRWESHQAEYQVTIPPAELARIRADSALKNKIREAPSLYLNRISFSLTKPFDDVRVRQAVAMAVDKKTIAARSQVGIPLDGIYPSRMPQYDPSFKSDYQYDLDKAKKLMADAGHAGGIKANYYVGGLGPDLAQIIQEDLKKIGLETELISGDPGLYKDRLLSGDIPMSSWGFSSDFPDANSFVSLVLVCGLTPSPSGFCDDQITTLTKDAEKLAISDPKRTALYRQIQQIAVNEKVMVIPINERKSTGLGQSYVHGDLPDPVYLLPAPETVWMEAA